MGTTYHLTSYMNVRENARYSAKGVEEKPPCSPLRGLMQTLSVKKQKPPVPHEAGGFCSARAQNGRERTQQKHLRHIAAENIMCRPCQADNAYLIRHSPSRSHFDMTLGGRYASKICDGQVRLSIGIEDADDLIAVWSRHWHRSDRLRRIVEEAFVLLRFCL